MHIWIIITFILSVKSLVERDLYKFIACNPSEVILKNYSAKELRWTLTDIFFRIFCTIYEQVFYVALFLHTKTLPVLTFGLLHWGVFAQEIVNSTHRERLFSEEEWRRRVIISKVWAGAEAVFLGYLLITLSR